MKISGKRVLVTGASRGIGEALAKRFAQAGGRVALVARSEGPIKELASELGGTAHPTDLADPAAVDGLIGRIEADGGPVDILVNNAGVFVVKSVTTIAAAEIDQIYRLNLVTPAELCRQAIPRMLERGGGHIVNVSSLAGTGVFPGIVTYSSSKAGLSHFTAGLRADLRKLPVGTTLVELGPIPSDMLDQVEDYGPTEAAFKRFYRLHMIVEVSRDKVADEVVAAVEHDRRHVRIPKRALLFPLLTEAPRRAVEVLLTGVKHQD